jgi:hypothetical protein
MTKDKVLMSLNRGRKKENIARLREDTIEKLNSMSDDQLINYLKLYTVFIDKMSDVEFNTLYEDVLMSTKEV